MSTATTTPTRAARVSTAGRPTFGSVVRSETVKLFSVRSTLVTLGGIVACGLGGALFLALTIESSGVPSSPSLERTLGDVTMTMVILGQIMAGILGALTMGAEYSSGTVKSTFTAVPRRTLVLLAKATVLFVSVTATALATVLLAWGTTYPMYAKFGLEAPLSGYGVVGALLGSAVYLGLCAVFGLGLATIVRSTTVTTILVFFAMLLGPILSSLLPFNLFSRILRLMLLGNAGDAMTRPSIPDAPFLTIWGGHISPSAGLMLASGWVVLALVVATIVLKRRDV